MGLPAEFLDLACLRVDSERELSVWKKWPGSVERDMTFQLLLRRVGAREPGSGRVRLIVQDAGEEL
jgi:hypothetical protein